MPRVFPAWFACANLPIVNDRKNRLCNYACLIGEGAGCKRRYHACIRAKFRSTLENDFVGQNQALNFAATANGDCGVSMNEGLVHAHIVANGNIALLAIQDQTVRKAAAGTNINAGLVDENRIP